MEVKLYYLLSTRSKRAMVRQRKKWGHAYHYIPRGTLLERLSQETGMSIDQVYTQLMRERAYMIRIGIIG